MLAAMEACQSATLAGEAAYRSAMLADMAAYRSAMLADTAAYRSAMLAGVTVSIQMMDLPHTVVEANSTPSRQPDGLSISTSSGPAAFSTASVAATDSNLLPRHHDTIRCS